MRYGGRHSDAEPLFRRALEGTTNKGAQLPMAFRARLGLLRCAIQSVEEPEADEDSEDSAPSALSVRALAEALEDLVLNHEEELPGSGVSVRPDVLDLIALRAHAELLLDAWSPASIATSSRDLAPEELEILQLYARGQETEAVTAALQWYKQTAGGDMAGLIASYCSPERRLEDRSQTIPRLSIYAQNPSLAVRVGEGPGPTAPRALLRRLVAALGSQRSGVVADAMAELEFLLDTKEFVPFHTRRPYMRKGGRPHWGRGTGKRSGFSRRYWICWGPDRFYPNTRKMGSPHSDKND